MRSLQTRFLIIVVPLALLSVVIFGVLFEYQAHSRAMADLLAKQDRIAKTESIILAKSLWEKNYLRVTVVLSSLVSDPDIQSISVIDKNGAVIRDAGDLSAAAHPDLVRDAPISFATNEGIERIGKFQIVMSDKRLMADRRERLGLLSVLGLLLLSSVVVSAVAAHRWTIQIPLRLLMSFRAIVENLPSAIFLKDLEGRFQLVNSRFEEWYGRSAQSVENKTLNQVFDATVADDYASLDREVLRSEQVCEADITHTLPDGKTRQVCAISFPVRDAKGRVVGIGTVDTDVTEQRETQERLRQAQKLRSIGQLTGGVAHDFNNLLAIILGNAEILGEGLEGSKAKHLQQIIQASERGASLTQQLLAFSRRQPLRPQALQLQDKTDSLIALLSRTLGETIEVDVRGPSDLWPILVDQNQLETGLINLAINARDAMPAGGKLTIECSNVSLAADDVRPNSEIRQGDYVAIMVSDSGTGMAKEVLEHAFEPFYTTKDVGKGSGLGLSMVHGFAQQSHGHVSIYSEEGIGTTVTLYLPRADQVAVLEDELADVQMPRGRDEMVLVLEDDLDVRRLAVQIIESLGYQVLSAKDAKEAGAVLASADHVDLLLSDVVLPGGTSGPDFAAAAQRDYPHLKVLFMSGYPTEAAGRNRLLASGATLLNKPFQKRVLAEALSQALADRRRRPMLREVKTS